MGLIDNLKNKGNSLLKKIAGNPINVPFENSSNGDILATSNQGIPSPNNPEFKNSFIIDNEE